MAISDLIVAALNLYVVIYFKTNVEPKKAIIYDKMLENFKYLNTGNFL
jgi:hypothetical protein